MRALSRQLHCARNSSTIRFFCSVVVCNMVSAMSSLGEVLYISRLEVERLGIQMREVIRVVEEAFSRARMCMNLGLAIEDMATATLIYEKAKKAGFGTELLL